MYSVCIEHKLSMYLPTLHHFSSTRNALKFICIYLSVSSNMLFFFAPWSYSIVVVAVVFFHHLALAAINKYLIRYFSRAQRCGVREQSSGNSSTTTLICCFKNCEYKFVVLLFEQTYFSGVVVCFSRVVVVCCCVFCVSSCLTKSGARCSMNNYCILIGRTFPKIPYIETKITTSQSE